VEVSPDDGDDSLEVLFRRGYAPLVRALSAAVGAESAADAVQDAFLQADRHWSRVKTLGDPMGWVRRVAVNRVADQRRGWGRRERALSRLGPTETTELVTADFDLVKAVQGLAAGQRLAVCLFYLADLPVSAVADALGVSVGTVKSNLHDARRMLRKQLEVRDG
jgi:RNA polymerase sigma-70 factor (ECF subfamily)